MKVVFEIRFGRSKSSKMNEADDLACRMGAKQRGLKYHIEFTDIKDVFHQWENINALLNLIDKWKGFEIYYNGFLCTVNKEYRTLFYSIQDNRRCYFQFLENSNIETSCFYHDFACAKLSLLGGLNHWYNYGYTHDYKHWYIDKVKIMEELKSCIESKKLESCPAFNIDKVYDKLMLLPEFIEINEHWELLYRLEIERGLTVKRPYDIRPNFSFSKLYLFNEIKEFPMFELINNKLISISDKNEITHRKLVHEFLSCKFREN